MTSVRARLFSLQLHHHHLPQITTNYRRRWLASKANEKTDDPIPFCRSKARTFSIVDDAITIDDEILKRRSFAVPIGLLSFAAIIYLGFIRQEGAVDQKVTDCLTADISDKIPKKTDSLPTDTLSHK